MVGPSSRYASVAASYAGHRGNLRARDDPFGSPLIAKATHYSLIASASLASYPACPADA